MQLCLISLNEILPHIYSLPLFLKTAADTVASQLTDTESINRDDDNQRDSPIGMGCL